MFELWPDWKLPEYPDHAMAKRQMVLVRLLTLNGKNLSCWCPLPEPGERDTCHAAVLLERANISSK
jgi:hypothetical protein